ncbi:VOC family protein [Candidatus Bipolaricaulota bacterium]
MEQWAPKSSITWFYYDSLDEASAFYGDIIGLDEVLDAGWAKIFKLPGKAFIGLVDAAEGKGACQTQETNAVLLTLVVDDVPAWYERLAAAGVQTTSEVKLMEEIQIRTFFLTDPGGYALEIQEFLAPEARAMFH